MAHPQPVLQLATSAKKVAADMRYLYGTQAVAGAKVAVQMAERVGDEAGINTWREVCDILVAEPTVMIIGR